MRLRRPMDCGCPNWWWRWWLKAHQGSCCIRGSLPRTSHCSRRRRQQRISWLPSKTGGRSSSSAGGAGAGASGPAGGAGGVTYSGPAGGAGGGTSSVPAGGAGVLTSSEPAGGAGDEMTSGFPGGVGGWTSSSICSASGAAGGGSGISAIFSSIGGGGGGKASMAHPSCVVAAGRFVVVVQLEEGRLGGVGKRIFPLFLLPRMPATWGPNSSLWAKERASAGISCTLARAATFPGAWYFRLGTSSNSGGKDIRLVMVLPSSLCFFPARWFCRASASRQRCEHRPIGHNHKRIPGKWLPRQWAILASPSPVYTHPSAGQWFPPTGEELGAGGSSTSSSSFLAGCSSTSSDFLLSGWSASSDSSLAGCSSGDLHTNPGHSHTNKWFSDCLRLQRTTPTHFWHTVAQSGRYWGLCVVNITHKHFWGSIARRCAS